MPAKKPTFKRKWIIPAIILGIFAVILFVIFGPYLFIWALNTLFGLHIAFNIYTWFAALIILAVLALPRIGR